MNYKTIAVALSAVALIVPAGLALANNGGQSLGTSVGVAEHAQAGLNIGLRGGSDDNSSTSIDIEAGERGNATSTERSRGKQGDKERGLHATTTASTTNSHEGFGKGGLVGFFRWFLGLPDTTTVGDIRAQIAATTTASTTTSASQGLGFWAHILGFLHLGKGN